MSRRTIPLAIGAATALLVTALTGCSATAPVAEEPLVTVESAGAWMDAYLEAWETKDTEAVMALFSEDAVYQSIPGVDAETFVGRDAIGAYWDMITAGQSDISTQRGTPIVSGDQASIEIWVTFASPYLNPEGDNMVTLLEANILTFDEDGLVTENAEYWNIVMGVVEPPAGWGAVD